MYRGEKIMHEGLVEKVGVVGLGAQGWLIAFRCASAHKVTYVYDVSNDSLKKAINNIQNVFTTYVNKGLLTREQAEEKYQKIHVCSTLAECVGDADIVIEAVPENLALKQKIWQEIDVLAPQRTLLATNSSSMCSSKIGADVSRKDRMFNINLGAPDDMGPPKLDPVEFMYNSETSENTKFIAKQFLNSLQCIIFETHKEIQGFSFNRVWRAVKKECLFLWANGYSSPEMIDRAWMLEFHTTFGPFALMDQVGLDVVRDIELNYYFETGDESDKPPMELEQMVAKGHLGVKTGKGFYQYPNPVYKEAEWLSKKCY
ncbi:3-hydroxyacyl-CoA dehydrogenase family protein [Brevibacillus fluminis]|uniref:3-hydroxyacyl-CoA dehydrogenase family protein n=2 Tax=Brevibacillus fluminis TaxID=511487 RepID=A0A3M8CWT1_9BACL|nr:3-hydroxyacyl-CoA dehydrogenase family protein [Brevibacillus fluminis]